MWPSHRPRRAAASRSSRAAALKPAGEDAGSRASSEENAPRTIPRSRAGAKKERRVERKENLTREERAATRSRSSAAKQKNAETALHTCVLLVICVQAIATMACVSGAAMLRRANRETQTSAAASRWRQSDGRSVQDVRDERRRSECRAGGAGFGSRRL